MPQLPSTVLVSRNRIAGFAHEGINLTPAGLNIRECGTYSVHFSVFVSNDSEIEPIVPMFLSTNGSFDPTLSSAFIAGVASLSTGTITSIEGSGILRNVDENTFLTIISGSGGQPANVNIVGWFISAFKIE